MKYSGIKGLVVGSFLTGLTAFVTPNKDSDSFDRVFLTPPAPEY